MIEQEMLGKAGQAAKRQTQVAERMSILGSTLSSVEDSARELADRLVMILRDPVPVCASDQKDEEGIVPLASDLRSFHSRCAGTNEILIDILQRLEI